MKPSTESLALRKLCQNHFKELLASFKTEYDNGYNITFPTAVGFVNSNAEIESIEAGQIDIEIVDGNHTDMVMKQLRDIYPEEECFKER